MGFVTTTIQNLEIVAVDVKNNVILVKGNVPGPKKGLVVIRTATKNPNKINKIGVLVNYDTYEAPKVVEDSVEEVVENEEVVEEAVADEVAETEPTEETQSEETTETPEEETTTEEN